MAASSADERGRLRHLILQRCDVEQLRDLCFALDVDYDDLRGEGRSGKVRELVLAMERRGRLDELEDKLLRMDESPLPIPSGLPRPLHQLPQPPGDFTGRRAELAELEETISAGGATISGLHGMGGVGKTVLALVLAQRLTPRYPDAQFFLDLRGTSAQPLTAAEAMAHVIRAYYPRERLPETEAELAPLYHSVLHGQRALLLMDNAASRAQVEPLLCPDSCLLLVTSRTHFTLPGFKALNLDALPLEEAVELVCGIAPRLRHEKRPPLNPPRTVHGGRPDRRPRARASSSPPVQFRGGQRWSGF